MTQAPSSLRASAGLLALGLQASVACGGAAAPPAPVGGGARVGGALRVVAEGPCARLSVQAIGARRLLVYGDTGYDLHAWLPGEAVAAAQSLAELLPAGAARDVRLLSGLPTDGRGYVPGELRLGGADEPSAWLERITTRYERGGRGALFQRHTDGFTLGAHGWERAPTGAVVSRPAQAKDLPALPTDACVGARTSEGEPRDLELVPLAAIPTPSGGVLVAGRCADRGPQNLPEPVLRVLHGRAGNKAWTLAAPPAAPELDGIVNVELFARSDDDALLTVWEPFDPPHHRRAYVAHWEGAAWKRLDLPVEDGLMSVAGAPDGSVLFAASRALYRLQPSGRVDKVALPAPRFVRGLASAQPAGGAEPQVAAELHVHTVRTFGEEIWVEASYRVELDAKGAPAWASVLYSNVLRPRVVYCDAREPAAQAVWEVE